MKHWVYVKFPKAGLGNLLLIWARAKVFSHRNGYPLITSPWWGIRWGSWIRNEQKKRVYWGYFRESSLMRLLFCRMVTQFHPVINEPKPAAIIAPSTSSVFCFKTTVVQNDLFDGLREHRNFLKTELIGLLNPEIRKKLACLETPEIAIHIRRGDFKSGNPITPDSFFTDTIKFIRSTTNRKLRVTVYSDAAPEEIKAVLDLEGVVLAGKKPDILDLLEMSRSRILVLSQSSTFSYWAAFLSDAIVIKPAGDWQNDIRPPEVNKRTFEGKISFDQPESLRILSQALQQEKW